MMFSVFSSNFFWLSLLATVIDNSRVSAAENDTSVVGSLIHEMKMVAPSDMIASATSGGSGRGSATHSGGAKRKGGYHKSQSAKDDGGYDNFDNYNVKDGDSYGFQETVAFGKKEGDGVKKGYHKSSRYGKNDDDDFFGSDKPKYSEYHYEHKSGSPPKEYRYESDDTQPEPRYQRKPARTPGNDGHKYQSLTDASGARMAGPGAGGRKFRPKNGLRKKKEQLSAGTAEYENFELYGEPEEAAPVQEYEEEADPEYAAVYADYGADVYY